MKNNRHILAAAAAVLALALLAAPSGAGAKTYKVDPDHSSVAFSVRHLLGKVRGRFDRFEGRIVFDANDPAKTEIEGAIDAGSINTNVPKRDQHLRSDDFFDVEKFPKITFKSTKVTDVDRASNSGKLHGTLTIRGVARPVILEASFLGDSKDPWGNQLGAFTARTKINRKDFGLNWNEVLETGGLMVGEEVEIEIEAAALIDG